MATNELPKNLTEDGLAKYQIWGDDDRPAKYEGRMFYIVERGDNKWTPRNDLIESIMKTHRYAISEEGLKDWKEKVKKAMGQQPIL